MSQGRGSWSRLTALICSAVAHLQYLSVGCLVLAREKVGSVQNKGGGDHESQKRTDTRYTSSIELIIYTHDEFSRRGGSNIIYT